MKGIQTMILVSVSHELPYVTAEQLALKMRQYYPRPKYVVRRTRKGKNHVVRLYIKLDAMIEALYEQSVMEQRRDRIA